MRTIYKVWRDLADLDDSFLRYRSMKDGEYLISHAGISVPVTIKGSELTIHVAESTGRLENVLLYGLKDPEATLRSIENQGDLNITLDKEHSIGLHFHPSTPYSDLSLEYYEGRPKRRSRSKER